MGYLYKYSYLLYFSGLRAISIDVYITLGYPAYSPKIVSIDSYKYLTLSTFASNTHLYFTDLTSSMVLHSHDSTANFIFSIFVISNVLSRLI